MADTEVEPIRHFATASPLGRDGLPLRVNAGALTKTICKLMGLLSRTSSTQPDDDTPASSKAQERGLLQEPFLMLNKHTK